MEEVLINSMSFSTIDLIIKIRMMIIEVDISLKCKLSSTSVLLIEQGWIQDFSSGGGAPLENDVNLNSCFFVLYFFFSEYCFFYKAAGYLKGGYALPTPPPLATPLPRDRKLHQIMKKIVRFRFGP